MAATMLRPLCGLLMVAIVAGCGSGAPPRSLDEPPVMSEYKGWIIAVTPSRIEDLWRARVRVWPPEVRPETHSGINVRFSGASTTRNAVEQTATAVARQYIDASVSTR
jgi:hypothetical protein